MPNDLIEQLDSGELTKVSFAQVRQFQMAQLEYVGLSRKPTTDQTWIWRLMFMRILCPMNLLVLNELD